MTTCPQTTTTTTTTSLAVAWWAAMVRYEYEQTSHDCHPAILPAAHKAEKPVIQPKLGEK